MSQWFRMYAEVLDDPKVQRLSGDEFKAWVNILCLRINLAACVSVYSSSGGPCANG